MSEKVQVHPASSIKTRPGLLLELLATDSLWLSLHISPSPRLCAVHPMPKPQLQPLGGAGAVPVPRAPDALNAFAAEPPAELPTSWMLSEGARCRHLSC